jgi:hypothetical protein
MDAFVAASGSSGLASQRSQRDEDDKEDSFKCIFFFAISAIFAISASKIATFVAPLAGIAVGDDIAEPLWLPKIFPSI